VRNRRLSPEIYENPKRLILGKSKVIYNILPFVDQRSPNLVRIYRIDPSLQRCFPIDDILLHSRDIHDRVAKLSKIEQKSSFLSLSHVCLNRHLKELKPLELHFKF